MLIHTRQEAIKWWNDMSLREKKAMVVGFYDFHERVENLTGREIETIWNKYECLIHGWIVHIILKNKAVHFIGPFDESVENMNEFITEYSEKNKGKIKSVSYHQIFHPYTWNKIEESKK